MGKHHVAPVGGIGQATGGINRIQHGERHVSNGLLARFIDLAGDIGFLRAESGDINVHLRVGDVLR